MVGPIIQKAAKYVSKATASKPMDLSQATRELQEALQTIQRRKTVAGQEPYLSMLKAVAKGEVKRMKAQNQDVMSYDCMSAAEQSPMLRRFENVTTKGQGRTNYRTTRAIVPYLINYELARMREKTQADDIGTSEQESVPKRPDPAVAERQDSDTAAAEGQDVDSALDATKKAKRPRQRSKGRTKAKSSG